jgi:hypothetical protein
MNDLLHVTAPRPSPPREEPLTLSRNIPPQPRAGTPAIATRTRRHWLPRVRAAFFGRRRTGNPPGPGSWASAGSGVSPIASGASRGLALFVGR